LRASRRLAINGGCPPPSCLATSSKRPRARSELDRELEQHVIDSFLDRIERSIDARVDARIDARMAARMKEQPQKQESGPSFGSVVLALGSIGCGIGATGAATGMGGSEGFLVAVIAWLAIAAINVANAVHR
jgi:hypothetical protein